jgi:hypothetical protein
MWFHPDGAVDIFLKLAQAQRSSRFKTTETVLNRLIINTIETGAITAGLAVTQLTLFKAYPTTYYDITALVLNNLPPR